jgi:hypothetical protein
MAAGVLLHQITGQPREILDRVLITNAKKFPLMAIIPKGPVVDTVHYEWPLDTYEDPTDNAAVDGTDITTFSNAQSNYSIVANRMQWFREKAMVGELAEVEAQAGIKNKRGYAIKKKMEKLYRDIEAMLGSDNDVQVGTGSVPNKCRGIGKWLTTSLTTSGYAVGTDFTPTSDQLITTATGSLAQSEVQTALQKTWERGNADDSDEYQLVCGGNLRARFTTFTSFASGTNTYATARFYSAEMSKKVIWATIDRFEGDFGRINLIPSHWNAHANVGGSSAVNLARGYALKPSKWELIWKWMPKIKPLPDGGGGERFMVHSYMGLRCLHPGANFAFKGTS